MVPMLRRRPQDKSTACKGKGEHGSVRILPNVLIVGTNVELYHSCRGKRRKKIMTIQKVVKPEQFVTAHQLRAKAKEKHFYDNTNDCCPRRIVT